MPRDGALTLSDVLSPTLSIVCEPCNRHGRYSVARLLEEHGDAKLTDLLQALADCPKARSASIYDRCKVVYEGLTGSLARLIATSRRTASARLVLAEPDVNRVSQDGVGRPSQIRDLRDEPCSTQCTQERTSGEPKRVLRGGGTLRGDVVRAKGSRRRRRSASTFATRRCPFRPTPGRRTTSKPNVALARSDFALSVRLGTY
jgi:hypothetical protein